ncbi:hypothetical protein FB570_11376 [Streptomyces sp. T12]|nr:hypothetical protein FB570_11376 [Streptomyces sp. T12]
MDESADLWIFQKLGQQRDRFPLVGADHVRVDVHGHADLAGLRDGTVVEFAIGVHAASRFAWEYDFKVPDSARDGEGQQ